MTTTEEVFGAGNRIIPAELAEGRLVGVADLLDDLLYRFNPDRVMADGYHAVRLAVDLLETIAAMVATDRMALGRCADCEYLHLWTQMPDLP